MEAISPFSFSLACFPHRGEVFVPSCQGHVNPEVMVGEREILRAECIHLLSSSPQPVRPMELAVAALRDLPRSLQRAGATREERICKLPREEKHHLRRQKARTERCRGRGSGRGGMTFDKVADSEAGLGMGS